MLVPDQSVFVDWQKVKVQEDSAQVRWHIQEQSLGKQLTCSKTNSILTTMCQQHTAEAGWLSCQTLIKPCNMQNCLTEHKELLLLHMCQLVR